MRKKIPLIYVISLMLASWAFSYAKSQTANQLYHKYENYTTEHLRKLGSKLYSNHQSQEALACYSVLINRHYTSTSHADRQTCASALNNRGCVYKYMFFDYSNAYEDLSTSLKICEKEKLVSLHAIVCANLGTLLNDYSRQYSSTFVNKEAMRMFKESFDGALAVKNWELLATSFMNMAEFNHDINLSHFQSLFKKDIPDSTTNLRYARYLYHAIECLNRKDYAGARLNFTNQLKVNNSHNTPERNDIVARMNIAKVSIEEGNWTDAKHNLKIAELQAIEHQARDLDFQICKLLSDTYNRLGMTDSARYYRISYLEKRDSLTRASQLMSVGERNFVMELKQEEEKVKELTAKQQRHRLLMGGAIMVILITLLFIFIIRRKNKQLAAHNGILYSRMQEMMKNDEKHLEQLKLYESQLKSDLAPKQKYSTSNLDMKEKEELLNHINEVMNNRELICKQGFNIAQLAQEVGSNTTYVSQVINEKYGHTFNVLLGNNRIIEACRRIRDEKLYKELTIEAISQSVGFKSRVTFVNAFKRVVGLTPSEYIKMAQSQQ